jgi:hypothetical protein
MRKCIFKLTFISALCLALPGSPKVSANPSFFDDANVPVTEQQDGKTVKGTVTDAKGDPLPGVTIVIKGTMSGTTTGPDGNYQLTGISDNAVLVISFVGLKTREIEVGGRSTINVAMQEETVGIEEVVAVGYGTQRKKTDRIGRVFSPKMYNRCRYKH